jgi:hypothetical protein
MAIANQLDLASFLYMQIDEEDWYIAIYEIKYKNPLVTSKPRKPAHQTLHPNFPPITYELVVGEIKFLQVDA